MLLTFQGALKHTVCHILFAAAPRITLHCPPKKCSMSLGLYFMENLVTTLVYRQVSLTYKLDLKQGFGSTGDSEVTIILK